MLDWGLKTVNWKLKMMDVKTCLVIVESCYMYVYAAIQIYLPFRLIHAVLIKMRRIWKCITYQVLSLFAMVMVFFFFALIWWLFFFISINYCKIPKISPSKYKPPKLGMQKTLRMLNRSSKCKPPGGFYLRKLPSDTM